MEETPKLHQQLLNGVPKKRGRKKEGEPDPVEVMSETISALGPILTRALTQFDNYTMIIKTDAPISFNKCAWLGPDDNFITLYRKTVKQWEIVDVNLDDISYVSLSMPITSKSC